MELALAAFYVALPTIAIVGVLRWLAPQMMKKLPDIVPGFWPLCIVVLTCAIIATSIMLRKPAPGDIDSGGLALVSITFVTPVCVIGVLAFGLVSRLVERTIARGAGRDESRD